MGGLADEYSIGQAVKDGVLHDMTALAHESGLPYPTFISTSFLNSAEIAGSETRLRALLEDAWIFRKRANDRAFGTDLYALEPDLKKRGWPKAAFPRHALMNFAILPSASCGVMLVITGGYEKLDLRISRAETGSFYTM